MSTKEKQENKPVTAGQKVFDNIWLLFLLSLLISTLIYNVWGILDLLSVPPAP
jgi:zona occludens toxin (predicted ATPase)